MMRNTLCMIVTCLQAWIALSAGLQVKVKPDRDSFIRRQGASMLLTCVLLADSAEGEDRVSLQWINPQGNKIEQLRGRVYKEEEDYPGNKRLKLYMTTLLPSDAGQYTCKATNNDDISEKAEKSVTITLWEDIRIEAASSVVKPLIYTDALLPCTVHGNPKPEVSWRFGHRRIQNQSRYEQRPDGLLIHNVTEADNGRYTCRAEVEEDGRYDMVDINVSVHDQPQITEDLQNTEGLEGEFTSFRCRASGVPTPSYEFYKDGVQILTDTADVRRTVNAESGELILNSLVRRDAGNYSCKAVSEAGQALSQTVSLLVFAPATVKEFNSVTLTLGEPLALKCQFSGYPSPNAVISRAGFNYMQSDQREDMEVDVTSGGDGELVLVEKAARVQDAGQYECMVENNVGRHSLIATVTVQHKPKFSSSNTQLVYGWAGSQQNLSCQVYAAPEASVTWVRGGAKVESDDNYRIFESSDGNVTFSTLQVTIRESVVSWIFDKDYICEASNVIGTERQQFELKRAVHPDRPQSLQVLEALADSITLEVEEPSNNGGNAIIGYYLIYSEQSSDGGISDDIKNEETDTDSASSGPMLSFTDTKVRITYLKPSTTYVLSVSANNMVGAGPKIQITVTTSDPSVPGKIFIQSPPLGNHHKNYDLNWELHSNGGHSIIEYQLNYTKVHHDNGSDNIAKPAMITENVPVDNDITSYRLSNLSPKSIYILHMRARNKLGYGPITEPFNFYTLHTDDEENAAPQVFSSSLGLGMTIGVVLIVLLVIFLVIDVRRHTQGQSSLTTLLCGHRVGAEKSGDIVKSSGDVEKQALKQQQENGYHHADNIDEKIPLKSGEAVVKQEELSDVIMAGYDNGDLSEQQQQLDGESSNEMNGEMTSTKPTIV